MFVVKYKKLAENSLKVTNGNFNISEEIESLKRQVLRVHESIKQIKSMLSNGMWTGKLHIIPDVPTSSDIAEIITQHRINIRHQTWTIHYSDNNEFFCGCVSVNNKQMIKIEKFKIFLKLRYK